MLGMKNRNIFKYCQSNLESEIKTNSVKIKICSIEKIGKEILKYFRKCTIICTSNNNHYIYTKHSFQASYQEETYAITTSLSQISFSKYIALREIFQFENI